MKLLLFIVFLFGMALMLIPDWDFRLPLSLSIVLFLLPQTSFIPLVFRLILCVLLAFIGSIWCFMHSVRLGERTPLIEAVTALLWVGAVLLPADKVFSSSPFIAVLYIAVIAAGAGSCIHRIDEFNRYEKYAYDYGGLTKEEIVQAVVIMCKKALAEQLRPADRTSINNNLYFAEKYLSDGKFTMQDAKALYSGCRINIKFAHTQMRWESLHGGSSAGSTGGSAKDNASSGYTYGRPLKYFAGISDKKELGKKFRELSKLYHPDNGGDMNTFVEMMNEYHDRLDEMK